MFETNQEAAEIVSVNLRNELHGDEKKGAVDIGMRMTLSNQVLMLFSPELLAMFYRPAASGQGELLEHYPDLRSEVIDMPIKCGYVGSGYETRLNFGMNSDKELTFAACQVDKFKFDMKPGGSVDIAFRIIVHPKSEDVGTLYELNGSEVELTLVAPSAEDGEQPEPTPQSGLFEESQEPPPNEVDVLYPRAVAAVRATGNPTVSALRTELKIEFNHAAQLLTRMLDEGVIYQDGDEYHVSAENAA